MEETPLSTPAPWAIALAITLGIELPLVALLFPGQRLKMAAVALAANTITNLTLNLALPRVELLHGWHVLVGEAFALVAETAAYVWASRPRDFARSLLASSLGNALSFAAGLIPGVSALLAG